MPIRLIAGLSRCGKHPAGQETQKRARHGERLCAPCDGPLSFRLSYACRLLPHPPPFDPFPAPGHFHTRQVIWQLVSGFFSMK